MKKIEIRLTMYRTNEFPERKSITVTASRDFTKTWAEFERLNGWLGYWTRTLPLDMSEGFRADLYVDGELWGVSTYIEYGRMIMQTGNNEYQAVGSIQDIMKWEVGRECGILAEAK